MSFAPKAAFALMVLPLALGACSELGLDPTYSDKDHDTLYKNGSLVSDQGGSTVGGGKEKKEVETSGIGVNGFLWRATLDTVGFMPLASADPFGGTVLTDWYAAPETPNERVKLNIYIRDRELRADGVRVTVFRQTKNANGIWSDATVAPSTATALENAILAKARQIRMAQKQLQ